MTQTDFINDKLYPTLFEKIDVVFKEFKFERRGDNWYSPLKLDGTSPKSKVKYKSAIRGAKSIRRAYENGGDPRGFYLGKDRGVDLITIYRDYHKISSDWEAVKQIASKLGLEIPVSPEAQKMYEARKAKEEAILLSHERQMEALFSPQGEPVLRYLKEDRGYSEEYIKKIGLGFITPEEAKTLGLLLKVPRQDSKDPSPEELERYRKLDYIFGKGYESGVPYGVGSDYLLSIAYTSKGRLIGFKFRSILSKEELEKRGIPKYKNTKNLSGYKNSLPYGLPPLSQYRKPDEDRVAIIVEGELDALRTTEAGLSNVIATTGDAIAVEAVKAIKASGFRQITLLLDNDNSGETFTEQSIETIQREGLTAMVATFPEGFKDSDEYLKTHTGEELKEIVEYAQYGYAYIYNKLLQEYAQKEEVPVGEYAKLEDEVITLANRVPDETQRAIILNDFASKIGKTYNGLEEAIKAKADRIREAQDELTKKNITLNSLSRAASLAQSGMMGEARSVMREAEIRLSEIEDRDKYKHILEDDTESLWESFKTTPKSLESRIELDYYKEKYLLSFPSGAVSVIAAPTNHGKSKVLQTLVLDALEDYKSGSFLYLTYEETREAVVKQFLNGFANLHLTKMFKNRNRGNLQTITEYLQTGRTDYMVTESREKFKDAERRFKNLLHSGRLKVVKPEDNFLHTLLSLLRFSIKNIKPRAIFLDYVQELYIDSKRAYIRTDELKEIMVEIGKVAEEADIPIIMAAQLKQETESPLELDNGKLADSKWIAYKASEVVLFWSNKEPCRGKDSITIAKQNQDVKAKLGLTLGEEIINGEGKLYFKLTKSRYIPVGASVILPINGNTGRVNQYSKPVSHTDTTQLSFEDEMEEATEPHLPKQKIQTATEAELPF